jgi:hypothetical protein
MPPQAQPCSGDETQHESPEHHAGHGGHSATPRWYTFQPPGASRAARRSLSRSLQPASRSTGHGTLDHIQPCGWGRLLEPPIDTGQRRVAPDQESTERPLLRFGLKRAGSSRSAGSATPWAPGKRLVSAETDQASGLPRASLSAVSRKLEGRAVSGRKPPSICGQPWPSRSRSAPLLHRHETDGLAAPHCTAPPDKRC